MNMCGSVYVYLNISICNMKYDKKCLGIYSYDRIRYDFFSDKVIQYDIITVWKRV